MLLFEIFIEFWVQNIFLLELLKKFDCSRAPIVKYGVRQIPPPFGVRVSLYGSPSCPGTRHVDLANLCLLSAGIKA